MQAFMITNWHCGAGLCYLQLQPLKLFHWQKLPLKIKGPTRSAFEWGLAGHHEKSGKKWMKGFIYKWTQGTLHLLFSNYLPPTPTPAAVPYRMLLWKEDSYPLRRQVRHWGAITNRERWQSSAPRGTCIHRHLNSVHCYKIKFVRCGNSAFIITHSKKNSIQKLKWIHHLCSSVSQY